MIHIAEGLLIPEDEIRFTASRSGGPGGQNVNKVSSKVTLAFDVRNSAAMSKKMTGKELSAIDSFMKTAPHSCKSAK